MDGQPAFRRDPRLKLSDQVAIELERQILGGAYKPGHRLPTEPELYEWLGVSRTVLRDALRTLASFGLITVRQGVGIVVAQPSDGAIMHALAIRLQSSDLTIGDVLAARTGLEVAFAAEAAQSYARALTLVTNDAERRFLERRLREVQRAAAPRR